MLIYRKTSRTIDGRAVFWFALGVSVTLCSAMYTHFDAAGACAKSNTTTLAFATPPAAQPARRQEPTATLSTESNAVPAAAAALPLARETKNSGEAKNTKEPAQVAAKAIAADVSLSATGEAGRKEATPVDAAPTQSPILPPDAASVLASGPSQADVELENQLRALPESSAARLPSATDTSLLPHEKL